MQRFRMLKGWAGSLAMVAALGMSLLVVETVWADDVFVKYEGGIDDATKARIKTVMQAEFTKAGAGLTVTDDPTKMAGATRIVCFVNDFASPKGDRWGDSGDGKTVKVYVKEFTEDAGVSGEFKTGGNFDATKLGNGLGETGAHEVGHTYGLEHNWDNPPTKMTTGSKVTAAQRAADMRDFNKLDSFMLKVNTNPGILDLLPRPLGNATDTGVVAFERPNPVSGAKHEDTPFMDVSLAIDGLLPNQFDLGHLVAAVGGGETFGLRSPLGERLLDGEPVAPAVALTLANEDVIQWALQGAEGTPLAGQVFTIADFGQLVFLDPVFNPFVGFDVFRELDLSWDVNHDSFFDVFVMLDSQFMMPGTTNGFARIAEPATIWLLLCCAAIVALRRRSR